MHKILLIITVIVAISCSKTISKNNIIFINSYTVKCQGVVLQDCMLTKKTLDQANWENFYGEIEGFKFEKGFEYKLEVKIDTLANPPADGSSLKYSLVKILEKNQKEIPSASNTEVKIK